MRPLASATLELRIAAIASFATGAATLVAVLIVSGDRFVAGGVAVGVAVLSLVSARSVGSGPLERQLGAAAPVPEGAEHVSRRRQIAVAAAVWLTLGLPMLGVSIGLIAWLVERADLELGVSAATLVIAGGGALTCCLGVGQLAAARMLERWEREHDAVLWSELWPLGRRGAPPPEDRRRRFYYTSEGSLEPVDGDAPPHGAGFLLALLPLEAGSLAVLGSFAVGDEVAAALLRLAGGVAFGLFGLAALKDWRHVRTFSERRRARSPWRMASPWLVAAAALAVASVIELAVAVG